MPITYLLLRNNKQTGPHSLDELLNLSLQPQDLVWVEGRSAGWCYPSEVDSLQSYGTAEKPMQPSDHPLKNEEKHKVVSNQSGRSVLKTASHIYVSLPAGMPMHVTEEPQPTPDLEAKAEALYQRVQAFAAGRTIYEEDTRNARSLNDMKQEYNAWQVKQHQKKSSGKKMMVIAACVLIVTATVFGFSKWIGSKSYSKQQPVGGYATGTLTQLEEQTTTASYKPALDTFTTTSLAPGFLKKDKLSKVLVFTGKTTKPVASIQKSESAKPSVSTVLVQDTTSKIIVTTPAHEEKAPEQQEQKKVVPLSRLVLVYGQFPNDQKGAETIPVRLLNNSTETLKSVTVVITYFRKEDKQLNKETIRFYNVQPATEPVINAPGNRRATTARFEISAIIRADGSLYLIH